MPGGLTLARSQVAMVVSPAHRPVHRYEANFDFDSKRALVPSMGCSWIFAARKRQFSSVQASDWCSLKRLRDPRQVAGNQLPTTTFQKSKNQLPMTTFEYIASGFDCIRHCIATGNHIQIQRIFWQISHICQSAGLQKKLIASPWKMSHPVAILFFGNPLYSELICK